MESKQALSVILNPAMDDSIRAALRTWDDANPAVIERTLDWLRGIREDLAALVRDVDDPEQLPETLAINYIELKSRWIAINTKVNYQTFRVGSCEPEQAFRGTAISELLGALESLLTSDDIEKITEFLSQPVRRAA